MSIIGDKATAAVNALVKFGNAIKAKKDLLVKSSLIGQPNGVAKLVNGTIPLTQMDQAILNATAGPTGDSGTTNYDYVVSVPGKPAGGSVVYYFVSSRTMSVSDGASKASCIVAPTSTVHIDIYVNSFIAGTATFIPGSTTGSVSWVATTLFSPGAKIKCQMRETATDATFSGVSITITGSAMVSYPTMAQTHKLLVTGYSAELNGTGRSDLTISGVSTGYAARSYSVVTLKAGGTLKGMVSFDLFTDVNNAGLMGAYILRIPLGTPFIVFSRDEPKANHLDVTILNFMMSKGATSFKYGGPMVDRAAYAYLCPNDGTAGIELYAGDVANSLHSAFTVHWNMVNGKFTNVVCEVV